MQITAQGWLVLRLTGSPALLGLAAFAGSAPSLALTLYAGLLADRIDRRKLLLWTQVVLAVLAAILALLDQTGAVRFWQVLVLAVFGGVANALGGPAFQALVPSLVDRRALGNAIALNSAQFNLGRILGPAAAGLLIGSMGEASTFWLNALSFVAVIVALAAIRDRDQAAMVRQEQGLWANLMDGFVHVRHEKVLLALLVLAGAPAVLILPYLALLPVYAQALGIGAPGLGLLTASIGVGALAGAVAVALLRQGGASGRTTLGGLSAMCVAVAAFSASSFVPISCVALGVLGAAQVLYYTGTNTLVQLLSPGRLRGRILSIYVLTSIGLTPLGSLLAGAVAQAVGAPITLVAGGALTAVALGLVLRWCPALARLRIDVEETPEGALKPSGRRSPQEG